MSKKGKIIGLHHAQYKVRRRDALKRLEIQLESGMRTGKKKEGYNPIPLTEGNIKRINKEISTLKERV